MMSQYIVESSSFSAGQIFGYWPSWKKQTKETTSATGIVLREIFNGYSKSELYVAPLHGTLKEEVIETGFVSPQEWLLHVKKAKEYLQTDKVKEMEDGWGIDFGSEEGAGISLTQILGIILYCDTNKLQNEFSCTFRKKNVYKTKAF